MNRRFLYMIVEASRGEFDGSCTLRRINPSRLFYPKDSPQRAAAAAAAGAATGTISEATATARLVKDARLPSPTTTFDFFSPGSPKFALLGQDKDKILMVGGDHFFQFPRADLYDDCSHTFHSLPSPRNFKVHPFWVAVGDSAYFMEDEFHRSSDDDDRHGDDESDDDEEDRYETTVDALVPHCHKDGDYSWKEFSPTPPERMDWKSGISAYAAVGESSIWMSAGSYGTLALDTASGAWSKAGDWPLPFVGRATEQGDLWFGFSADHVLEAWDLRADGGPASRHRWADMPGIVHGRAVESKVAVLGDGRLCVGRLFDVEVPEPPSRGHCSCCYYRTRTRPPRVFAMLTGVEVVDDGDGGGIRLIEHKSRRYNLGRDIFVQLLF